MGKATSRAAQKALRAAGAADTQGDIPTNLSRLVSDDGAQMTPVRVVASFTAIAASGQVFASRHVAAEAPDELRAMASLPDDVWAEWNTHSASQVGRGCWAG